MNLSIKTKNQKNLIRQDNQQSSSAGIPNVYDSKHITAVNLNSNNADNQPDALKIAESQVKIGSTLGVIALQIHTEQSAIKNLLLEPIAYKIHGIEQASHSYSKEEKAKAAIFENNLKNFANTNLDVKEFESFLASLSKQGKTTGIYPSFDDLYRGSCLNFVNADDNLEKSNIKTNVEAFIKENFSPQLVLEAENIINSIKAVRTTE
jgi:hypothetical protein